MLINLSPNIWSKHQFIFDRNRGLQLRHKSIGAVHFHSSLFISHVWKAIRTKPHHIWGNYKSQRWPRIYSVYETSNALQKYYLAHGCYTSLNSLQHCNMWILALMKAWKAAWMAVPATPLDSDELERRQFWSAKQHTVKHCENTSQDRELEDSQKGYKPSDLWASADAVLHINHAVNRIRWITLPSKMLGALWSFDESVLGEGVLSGEIWLGGFV